MQQELIEMLDKMVKYFDEISSDSYYYRETAAILNEAEKLVEKAKNCAKEPAVPVVDDLHDYPVCAVFRHGSCTCDAASNQRFEWCLKHIPGHLSDGIFDVLGCSTASENQIKKAIDSAIHAHTPANSEHQAIYTRISDGYMQDVFKSDGLAVEQDDEDDEPVPTVGTDAVIHAWNMLPGELQRNPHLQKLFEALKTCRDVAADPATPAAPSQEPVTDDLRQQLDVALGQVRYLLKDQAEKAAIIAALREKEKAE